MKKRSYTIISTRLPIDDKIDSILVGIRAVLLSPFYLLVLLCQSVYLVSRAVFKALVAPGSRNLVKEIGALVGPLLGWVVLLGTIAGFIFGLRACAGAWHADQDKRQAKEDAAWARVGFKKGGAVRMKSDGREGTIVELDGTDKGWNIIKVRFPVTGGDSPYAMVRVEPYEIEPVKYEEEKPMASIAYCVKCKDKREMKDTEKVTMKNGRNAMKGKCVTCNTGMYKILPNEKKD